MIGSKRRDRPYQAGRSKSTLVDQIGAANLAKLARECVQSSIIRCCDCKER